MPIPNASSRSALRRDLRARRRALSAGERRRAARRFGRHLAAGLPPRRLRHLAVYAPADGELDPLPALRHSRFQGAWHYLPVLDRTHRGRLRFHLWKKDRLWKKGHRLRANRFGIGEPAKPVRARAAWALDAILVPLVGFGDDGHRLGMGGGFYDRTLADFDRRPRRPRLVGVAYRFQQLPNLRAARWDRPVDQIITD